MLISGLREVLYKTTDKPRFLITTADMRSWRSDQPVLFLGEWCRLPGQQTVWESLDAEIVPPYGWKEGQRDADSAYVYRLSEQLLVELKDALIIIMERHIHCVTGIFVLVPGLFALHRLCLIVGQPLCLLWNSMKYPATLC